MKKLVLNREFAIRHGAVALLMLGLGGWFGYDGFVEYPKHDEEWFEMRHLQRDNAIQRQKEFMVLAFIAAAVIGGHLLAIAKFAFEYDENGFVFNGRRTELKNIKEIDRSKWEKKGIIRVDGIKLDAWHHSGVKEFEEILRIRG